MIFLNWFSKTKGHLKYKYDGIDMHWVGIETIISSITMTFDNPHDMYKLDACDAKTLKEFNTIFIKMRDF